MFEHQGLLEPVLGRGQHQRLPVTERVTGLGAVHGRGGQGGVPAELHPLGARTQRHRVLVPAVGEHDRVR